MAHNSEVIGPMLPMRGLRQGVPISPYIIILCVEVLSAYQKHIERQSSIHGCKIARNVLANTHLLFANDSYVFFRANMEECAQIKAGLHLYELAFGQIVNYSKSSIMFSLNTLEEVREELHSFLAVLQEN